MIDHVSVAVRDLAAATKFYDAVLGALGWRRHLDTDEVIAWGIVRPIFFSYAAESPGSPGGHICFSASGISAVKGSWESGCAAGGIDDGPPGPRPEYGASYYSAYLRDPDGHRIEVAVDSS